MSVFDNCPRDIVGPAQRTMGAFDYLNRSARSEAAAIRALIEQWVDRYPKSGLAGLVARLRSPDDVAHHSAFFELALHEMILRKGAKVLAVDAPAANGKGPDFLVELTDKSRLYIEAVLVTGLSKAEEAANRRRSEALATVNAVIVPGFIWDVKPAGHPSAPVRRSRLASELKKWAASLDYDHIKSLGVEYRDKTEPFVFEEHGLSISVWAHAPSFRERVVASGIGIEWNEPQWVKPQEEVGASVLKKSKKYGELEHPLVIAVDAMNHMFSEDDVTEALFGTQGVAWSEERGAREVRIPDGVWYGPRGIRNRQVVSVFVVRALTPWSVGQRKGLQVRNPYAPSFNGEVPLPGDLVTGVNGVLVTAPGQSVFELLGLPRDWPISDG